MKHEHHEMRHHREHEVHHRSRHGRHESMGHGEGQQRMFEHMEQNNQRESMVSHQSIDTPHSVAMDWRSGVFDMKHEAMDEAYGMAGKRDVERDFHKAQDQFREYNWS